MEKIEKIHRVTVMRILIIVGLVALGGCTDPEVQATIDLKKRQNDALDASIQCLSETNSWTDEQISSLETRTIELAVSCHKKTKECTGTNRNALQSDLQETKTEIDRRRNECEALKIVK